MIKSSFIFCSFSSWLKGIYHLAIDNTFSVSIMSTIFTGGIAFGQFAIDDSIFGTTNLVIGLVILTVFINTGFGISKSMKRAKELFAEAQKYESTTPKYKCCIRKSERFHFDIKKLNFVFFKCLSLMAYLFFVKALMTDGSDVGWTMEALNLTAEVLTKVPVAIFWYYEFKSIGENSEFLYGKKASIFKIVEGIFEPRIFKFYGSKTPADGVHNNFNDEENDGI
ncbi:MAG TPA: hypothetical protein VFM70_05910 [Salinimicrobium sp.]|nr:hypothetical protein [Salinimicrobium sp.]